MGSLSKEAYNSIPELGEAEKVLRDRILRLAQKGTSPYTALNLLKAYGSFQIGICLYLAQDQYVGYASVGLGIEKTNIPLKYLASPATSITQAGTREEKPPRNRYYKVESPELLSIKSIDAYASTWAFPLDDKDPARFMLLLVEVGVSKFNPLIMVQLLSDIREVLISQKEATLMPPQEAEEPVIPKQNKAMPRARIQKLTITKAKEVEQMIVRYHKRNPSFQGILLEGGGGHFEEDAENHFNTQVSRIVSSFGSVIPISSTRSLVLFQQSLDRDLIAHRLSKSLGSAAILDFEADNPQGAFALISPYF